MRDIGIGAAFGLFLGLLVGLSVSEVVAGDVTALVPLIGTILGLRSETAAGPLPGGNGSGVSGFALTASVAMVLAILARTHGLLEPSPLHLRDQWMAAGFSEEAARDMAAFQRLGVVPKGQSVSEARRSKADTGALYAIGVTDDACDALQNRTYASPTALISALNAEGGVWQKLAANPPAGRDAAASLAALNASVAALCQGRR